MRRNDLFRCCALCLSLFFCGACASKDRLFELTDKDFKPRGKTVAVVAGLKRDVNVFIAECMSQALQKNSTLVVTPSAQVAKAIPGYPLNIQGPYSAAYFDIETDYTRTDLEKIREVQKRLRVDYLYVIWVPTGSTLEKKIVFTDMISQLFEAPQSREVGRGWFWSRAGRSTGWFAPTPKQEDVEQSLQASCDRVSKEIAEATGTKRF